VFIGGVLLIANREIQSRLLVPCFFYYDSYDDIVVTADRVTADPVTAIIRLRLGRKLDSFRPCSTFVAHTTSGATPLYMSQPHRYTAKVLHSTHRTSIPLVTHSNHRLLQSKASSAFQSRPSIVHGE